MSTRIALHDDMLRSAFGRFDTDNSGYITKQKPLGFFSRLVEPDWFLKDNILSQLRGKVLHPMFRVDRPSLCVGFWVL